MNLLLLLLEMNPVDKIKDIVWAPAVGVVAVFVLVGVIVFLDVRIQEVRRQIFIAKEMINQGLGNLTKESAIRMELEKRSHDIDRIKSFVLKRDSVGDYITVLENEAARRGLDLRIPSVEEEVIIDDNGKVVEPKGDLKQVRMELSVSGGAEELLGFLSAVEYQSYLAGVASWDLVTGNDVAAVGSAPVSLRAGVLAMPGDREGEVSPSQPQARMGMEILLSIFNDDKKQVKGSSKKP
jgi:hypothetical protein